MVPDEVTILLAHRVEAGVERRARANRLQHSHVLRQPRVERQRELARAHRTLVSRNLKMSDHAERMHSGIGATRTVNTRRARKEFRQSLLHFLLNPGPDFLHLPPLVSSAVVSNRQFIFLGLHQHGTTGPYTDSRRPAIQKTLQ